MGRQALRTTLNLDEGLLEEVRGSGVRNVSRYVENLIKRDLRGQEKVGKAESLRVQRMLADLDDLEVEWFEFLKVEVLVEVS